MYIPTKYFVEKGTELPEGSTALTCKLCGGNYHVPGNDTEVCTETSVCEYCKETHEKQQAERNLADNKIGDTTTSDLVSKATGQ